jgi:ABC-2 type transport system permease protein
VRPALLAKTMGMEARKAMAYRADFWVEALFVFASEFGVAWFVWTAVFDATGRETVGGLTRGAAFLYYALVILVGKFVRGNEFGDAAVSQDIYEGGLTRYLLYPASYFGFKYAQHLGSLFPALLQLVLFGVAASLLLSSADVSLSAQSVAMGAVSVFAANLLYFLIGFPLHCVAFWADNVWSLSVAQRLVAQLLGGLLVPLSAWPAWAQDVLAWLPFRHLFWEPVMTVLGRRTPEAWGTNLLVALLWCAAFALLGRLLFRRGSLRYSGVGI